MTYEGKQRNMRTETEGSAEALARRKGRLRVAVCLPARNEAATIGDICSTVRQELMLPNGPRLVDELLVIDDSVDDTPKVASEAGARVVAARDVLPEAGVGKGKGEALWKSLAVTDADVIIWCDADLQSFTPAYVTTLLAPFLFSDTPERLGCDDALRTQAGEEQAGDAKDDGAQAGGANDSANAEGTADAADAGTSNNLGPLLVKGFYHRWLDGKPSGGGRTTELMARPLIATFFPELSYIRQPLAGEYAVRRSAALQVPFVEGYGVEMGLLIDLSRKFGTHRITQVDLGERLHRNRPLGELTPQALEILLAVMHRASCSTPDGQWQANLRAPDAEPCLVTLRERPPMATFLKNLSGTAGANPP